MLVVVADLTPHRIDLVVSVGEPAEVVLSGDVPGHLVHEEADPDRLAHRRTWS